MALLIVTGIANSHWNCISVVLQKQLNTIVDSKLSDFNEIHELIRQKGQVSVEKINKITANLTDSDHAIIADEAFFAGLDSWSKASEIKFIVFYASPVFSLAMTLSEQYLSKDECEEQYTLWLEQTQKAYGFYKQHKSQCLLLDVQDVINNNLAAEAVLGNFCGSKITLGDIAVNTAVDALLVANTLLVEQDDLFELYDEVRSVAPLFGEFKVSGLNDSAQQADEALQLLQFAHMQKTKATKLKHDLSSEIEKNKDLNLKVVEAQNELIELTNTSQQKLQSLEQQLSEMTSQYQQAASTFNQNKQAIEQKQQSIIGLEKKQAELVETAEITKQNLQSLEQLLVEKTTLQQKLENNYNLIKQELEQKQQALTLFEHQHADLVKTIEVEQQKSQSLEQQLTNKATQNQQTESSLKQTKQSLEQKIQALTALEQQQTELVKSAEIELQKRLALEQQLAKKIESHQQTESSLNQTKQTLEQKIQALTALEQQQTEFVKSAEIELQKRLALEQQLAKKIESHQQTESSLSQTKQTLEQKIQALTALEQQQTGLVKSAEIELQKRLALEQQLAKKIESHQQVETRLNEAKQTLEQKRQTIKEYVENEQKHIEELRSIKQTVKQLEQEQLNQQASHLVRVKDLENQLQLRDEENGVLKDENHEIQIQLIKTSEEYEIAVKDNQIINEQIEQLQKTLKQTQAETSEKTRIFESENELYILQIAQIQEELEAVFVENTTVKHALNEQGERVNQLTCDLENAGAALKEDVKQISYLQDQIAKTTQNADQTEQQLLAKIEQLQKLVDDEKHLAQSLTSQLETLKSETIIKVRNNDEKHALNSSQQTAEIELLNLQIAQLQEELESQMVQKSEVERLTHEQIKSHQQVLKLETELSTLNVEHEISILQINQLQEELEYYFKQLQEKDSNTLKIGETTMQSCNHVFDKISIESIDIVGSYQTDGYQDLKLLLNNLSLADGRYIDQLSVKMIEVEGRVGLEFRPDTEGGAPLRWREDMQDEYGSFIVYIPNPNQNQAVLQQKTNEILCASDRILILSIATALADALQIKPINMQVELADGLLRDWKLAAIQLHNQMRKLPAWMSFDQVTLIEEMREETYEHLWLEFDNLLVNEQLHAKLSVKIAAIALNSDDGLFTHQLMLELREQQNGSAPIQAWPPNGQDDYGYKFQVVVDLLKSTLVLDTVEKMSAQDAEFLRHLIKNTSNLVQRLVMQNTIIQRNINDWLAIGQRITEISQNKVAKEISPKEIESVAASDGKFVFYEHIDLGGYQHLVYQHELADSRKLLLKLRASDINPSSNNAKLSLELRTGDEILPLAGSPYFGEDEYGPRVLFSIEEFIQGALDSYLEELGVTEIYAFMEEVEHLVNRQSELNDKQKALWNTLLNHDN
jgi:hypothetical protein